MEEFGDFVVVRLDEERFVGQDLKEAFARGVDHELDAAAVETLQDALVNVFRAASGDRAGEDQYIALFELVEDREQRLDVLVGDFRAGSVHIELFLGEELDVDAGGAVFEVDELGLDALRLDEAFELMSGEPRRQRDGLGRDAETGQDDGHVDALAAEEDLRGLRPVDVL